jgi:hypothetical protein
LSLITYISVFGQADYILLYVATGQYEYRSNKVKYMTMNEILAIVLMITVVGIVLWDMYKNKENEPKA